MDALHTPAASLVVLAIGIGLIVVRQLRWRAASRAIGLGLALGAVGLLMMAQGAAGPLPDASAGLTWLALGAMLGTAVLAGTAMGLVSQVRLAAAGSGRRRSLIAALGSSADGWEIRGGWVGLAVWIAYIALRVAEGAVLGGAIPSGFAHAPATILLSLALVRIISVKIALHRARPRFVVASSGRLATGLGSRP